MKTAFTHSFSAYEESSGEQLHKQIVRESRVAKTEFTLRKHTTEELLEQQKRTTFNLNKELVYVLDNRWKVCSEFGFIVSPDGNIITESFSFPDEHEARKYLKKTIENQTSSEHKHIDGAAFVFTNVGFDNYYHALSELLPRLEWYLPFQLKAKLLVMKDSPDFVLNALSMLGVSESDIIWQEPGFSYSADALITLPYGLNFIPERFQFLRQKLLQPVDSIQKERKIYIPRPLNYIRSISNEEELIPVLKEYGFEIVDTEKLSLEEQISVFSETSHIAGPHGAGLTNILWQDVPNLLEIRPRDYNNQCFEHLALALGARNLSVLEAETEDPKRLSMNVDVDTFAEELAHFSGM
jgi:capsular polysaccharide biosynthesis protein